jgi:hypothetical protein
MIPFVLAAAFVAGIFVLFLVLLIFTEAFTFIIVGARGLIDKVRGRRKPPTPSET